ncbi:unnamed protein product [Brassica oleracea var. botrytis]
MFLFLGSTLPTISHSTLLISLSGGETSPIKTPDVVHPLWRSGVCWDSRR